MNTNIDTIISKCNKCKCYFTPTTKAGVQLKNCEKCRAKAKEAKNKMCEHGKRKTQCDECISNQIMMSKKFNMDSTNNDSYEIAAKKVFSDLYDLIKEDENKVDDKPFKFDLSIMPADVIKCIGDQLEDYPFEICKDTELFKMFFKHDKPNDYKEYIKFINDINNYKTYEEYDFTESCKTDIKFLLLHIKKYYNELNIKNMKLNLNIKIH